MVDIGKDSIDYAYKCHKCHIEKGVRMYLSLIDKKKAPGMDTSIPEASDMI